MTVDSKAGWVGGKGSMAEAMFESMWSGHSLPTSQITEGPLADFPEGVDPVIVQRHMREAHDRAFVEKTARIIGTDNNPDSSTMPGGNRMIQQGGSNSAAVVQQSPESARPPGEGDTKKDSAPTKGSRGSEIMSRIRAKRAEKGDVVGEETSTKSVGKSQGVGHNLQVKEQAPTPKELDPERRVGNLPDYHQRSSWTGSGPQAALHYDHQKVGELLKIAGVPNIEVSPDSLLARMAMAVKEASGPEYLTRNDVHPLKLVAELEDTLGEDWVEWEPETIRESIIKEAGVEPSDDVMSKIMAVKIIIHRPEIFFDDWMAMEKISVALNDQTPMMGMIEEVPIEWLSNAVSIVTKLAGDGDFGSDVEGYVAARLHDQGYVVAPPLLRFADDKLGSIVKNDDLRKKVILAYARSINAKELGEGEDPISIQVARLLRNNAYVLDRLDESKDQIA
jgi:hypothetical protein